MGPSAVLTVGKRLRSAAISSTVDEGGSAKMGMFIWLVLLLVLRARPPCVDVIVAVITMKRIKNIVIRAIAINLEIFDRVFA
jgi:hypothetical protein